ncbi:MAG: 3-oxoacyl-[acyl-carrier-protein] reductase [Rickettsiales bacterium]|jgi:3-oxoacyl-[acyl-carrier protein] reductase|nr:3-oxoacyl-[acyl-carrier-protein] reductase [Rickettsiales bacterium]
MLDFENQKVLITGATGGIGRAVSLLFAREGAVVGLCGRDSGRLKKLLDELEAESGKLFSFPCDLGGNAEQIEKLFSTVDGEMGAPDILICNAGMTKDTLSLRMSAEDFGEVIDVNLRATFILNREALKRMMRARYGRIINIGSVVGLTGNAGQANYAASKAGIMGLTKSLALEFANRGITVNCVAPGFIETPMTDKLNEAQRTKILSNIPTARLGQPEDVANAIAFLARKESGYITGQTIHVNGGLLMP